MLMYSTNKHFSLAQLCYSACDLAIERVFVLPSVRPSHAGNASKLINSPSISPGTPRARLQTRLGQVKTAKTRRFSTSKSFYLRDVRRQTYSYGGRLIGSRKWASTGTNLVNEGRPTFRPLDVSPPGRFALWTFRPRLWSFRPRQWTVRVRPRL